MPISKTVSTLAWALISFVGPAAAAIRLIPVDAQPVIGIAATDPTVTWYREARATPDRPGVKVACGRLGNYFFQQGTPPSAEPGTLNCGTSLRCGTEVPPPYPSYGYDGSTSTAGVGVISEVPIDASAAADGPRTVTSPSWWPCNQGSCFAAIGLEHGAPSGAWMAVIDWHDTHGWSVGWTALTLANANPAIPQIPAVLLRVDDSRLAPFSAGGATDVHVLAKLCEIVEAIDLGGAAPPLTVNMSFGRRLRSTDARSPDTCAPNTLNCQIAEISRYLTFGNATASGLPRSVPVAAAGNDREWIFPAALDSVLPAGSLQLGGYRQGRIERSWETPDYGSLRPQAVLPGYGLCIEEHLGASAGGNEWAAPAGTSYAAAIFSGWLAQVRQATAGGPSLDNSLDAKLWYPQRTCPAAGGPCTHALIHGSRSFGANPRFDLIANRTLSKPPRACGTALPVSDAETLTLKVKPWQGPNPLPPDTFMDVVGDLKVPTPFGRPCVPCSGEGSANGVAARPGTKAAAASFALDLSAATTDPPPFPPALASRANIEALYLRVNDLFVPLQTLYGESLNVLRNGTIRRISIPELAGLIPADIQPSLIFVVRPTEPDLAAQKPFWISVPILAHE